MYGLSPLLVGLLSLAFGHLVRTDALLGRLLGSSLSLERVMAFYLRAQRGGLCYLRLADGFTAAFFRQGLLAVGYLLQLLADLTILGRPVFFHLQLSDDAFQCLDSFTIAMMHINTCRYR